MDALSLAANIIAILGAVQSAVQTLDALRQLRFAPERLKELHDELHDFRTILDAVERIINAQSQQPDDPRLLEYLGNLTGRAAVEITKIIRLDNFGCVGNINSLDEHSIKNIWKRWLQHNEIGKLSTSLRKIRQDISTALTVLTASEVPRIRSALRDIVLSNEAAQITAKRTLTTTNQSIESMTTELAKFTPQLTQLGESCSTLLNPSKQATLSLSSQLPIAEGLIHRSNTVNIHSKPRCGGRLCMCQCHKSSAFISPRWARSVVGIIIVTWCGVLGHRVCNEKRCRRSQARLLKLDYYLPTWFIGRVISLRSQFTRIEGYTLSVRTPRLMPVCAPSFHITVNGNVRKLQEMFANGLASPFDVEDIRGASYLAVAVILKNPEICQFLLQQYADPAQENMHGLTPVSVLLRYLLEDPDNPCHQEMKVIFSQWADLDEALEAYNFSAIHQIILGLTSIDLRTQLELSTASIDSCCALGRTPLQWAIACGNLDAAKILLDFGASLDAQSNDGDNAFLYAARRPGSAALNMLLDVAYSRSPNSVKMSILTRADKLDNNAQTKMSSDSEPPHDPWVVALLNQVTRAGPFMAPINFLITVDVPENIEILLRHGAFWGSESGGDVPILIAISHNSHKILSLLLDMDVNLNAKDYTGQDIFHLAALLGDFETMRTLTEANLCCISTTERDDDGRTPLEAFDEQRSVYHAEDEETRLKYRKAFLNLLQSVKQAGSEHICRISSPCFNFDSAMVLDNASIYSTDDENEEFFEVYSDSEGLSE